MRNVVSSRMLASLLAWSLAAGAAGCAVDDDVATDLASIEQGVIIGNNDLLAVAEDGSNVPARYRPVLDAFGRLHLNGALCTATHVGDGLVVTAGHCFGAPSSRVDDRPCGGVYVEWGYRGGRVASQSNCTRILAMQTGGGRDYAFFRVSPVPAASVGVDLDSRPSNGNTLTIFSHPGGRPLEWSRTCPVRSTNGTELQYQCDTQGGSSGATVLRDGSLKVTGIHWGGGGDANVATQLVETPIGEFLGGGGPGPSTSVHLVARHSGKCMDVATSGTADGTDIRQWTCNGTAAQSFEIEDTGGGAIRLVNVNSGKCVDVSGSGTANGTNIQLWTCNGTNAQRFRQESAGGGYYRLVNVNSSKCADVIGNGTADGTDIAQWTCGSGTNQQWQLVDD